MASSELIVEEIRIHSRKMVRELGFTGRGFAGTDLSPSSVHALLEIEKGDVAARDIGDALHMDKSSVSRMLRKLIDAGWVAEDPGETDNRVKSLSLTSAGKSQVGQINHFARQQVRAAIERLTPEQRHIVSNGLRLYGEALGQTQTPAAISIQSGYRPGIMARITELHALFYARTAGFGQAFESVVAAGLAEFGYRLGNPKNAIWTAVRDGQIIGSIAIDGEDMGAGKAHLRWFIVDDSARGSGVGKQLLDTALAFVDAQSFTETYLWTFSGLEAARHLYESRSFSLAEERPGSQWGSKVLEQRFVRPAKPEGR
ncbi:GNAT family N-acetyltransferase [Agrobacterium tumefaciens]|nr:GNAT family N-acetyltransferase [Agrobacterium tumefaciens]